VDIRPLTTERLPDLADLFETNGVTRGCWCMYFLLTGKEFGKGWRGGNRVRFEEFARAAAVGGQDPPAGLLAYRDGEPVGWCAMGPRSRYPRALRSPVLKGRDPDEDGDAWLVPCFFIRRTARRAGDRGLPARRGRPAPARRGVRRAGAGVRRLRLRSGRPAHAEPGGMRRLLS
jgi:hypothetical protein